MKQQKIATFKGKYHEKQSTNYKRSDAQGNTKILQKFKKIIIKSNAPITKELIPNETTKYYHVQQKISWKAMQELQKKWYKMKQQNIRNAQYKL